MFEKYRDLNAKKIAPVGVFTLYFTANHWVFNRNNMFSILGGVPLGLQHLLDPPGHGVAEVLQVVPAELAGPEQLDLLDQVQQSRNVLSP